MHKKLTAKIEQVHSDMFAYLADCVLETFQMCVWMWVCVCARGNSFILKAPTTTTFDIKIAAVDAVASDRTERKISKQGKFPSRRNNDTVQN